MIQSRSGKIRINNPANDRSIHVFLWIAAILSIVSIISINIDWIKLASRVGKLATVFTDLSKLNFANINLVLLGFADSVAITILATVYSLILGLVMAAFIARNITPSKKLSAILSAFFSFLRAVPTPVWVLLALVCLGFGPAPGVVGLSVHATSFFARAFAQSFEE